MSQITKAILLLFFLLSLGCVSIHAKPEKGNWAEICKTVQQIVIPAIPSSLTATVPKDDVVVNLAINPNGDVTTVQLLSGSPAYGTLAAEAAQKWKFGKGPLSNKIPKNVEINFRFVANRDNYAISDEKDAFIVIVPLEVLDPNVLIAAGATIHSFAAIRMPAPFPPNAPRVSGRILVLVEVDDTGKVISARANSPQSAYQAIAEKTSLQWKFRLIKLNGNNVRLFGNLVFNWEMN